MRRDDFDELKYVTVHDDLAKSHYFSSDRLQYNCKRKVVEAAIIIFLNYEIFSNNI